MNVCYCSTKLAKVIGIKTKPEIPLATPPTSTGHWNAHLFYYGGKKSIIFMNKNSIYSVIIANYKKTDLSTLKLLFLQSLKEQCHWDGIPITSAQLRHHFSDFVFSTTDNDKSAIGSLNDLVYHAQASMHAGPPAVNWTRNETAVFNMNQMPMSAIRHEHPGRKFLDILNPG